MSALKFLVCFFFSAAAQAEKLELIELTDLPYTFYLDGAKSIFKSKMRKLDFIL